MNVMKIIPNVKHKRVVAMFPLRSVGAILLFLFLVPYVISGIFGNIGIKESIPEILMKGSIYVENKTMAGIEKIPLEIYVADKLSRVISADYEEEALKAQSVLIRTGLMEMYGEAETGKLQAIYMEDELYGRGEVGSSFWEAAAATQGICLTYQGEFVNASYFAISNGATRSAQEIFNDDYPYLQSVLCSRDFLASEYLSKVSVGRNEFKNCWERISGELLEDTFLADDFKLTRDSVGYVINVEYSDTVVSGEEFRELFGLSSASFQLEDEHNKVMITVKGVGHGLGMSQYAANELAKSDYDYLDILLEFFKDIEMTKIE